MESIPDRRTGGGGVMAESIRGLNKMNRWLKRLADSAPRKISKAAMSGAATPAKRAIRVVVQSSSISSQLKKAARQTISHRIGVDKNTKEFGLKVGFSLGKRKGTKRSEKAAARHLAGKGKGIGVGISASNVHWMALGTNERVQATTGRKTGRIMPAPLGGMIETAIINASGEMLNAAGHRAAVALKREAKKRR